MGRKGMRVPGVTSDKQIRCVRERERERERGR